MNGIIDAVLSLATQHLWQSAVLFGFAFFVAKSRALSAEKRSWLLIATFVLAAIAPLAALLPRAFAQTRPVPATSRETPLEATDIFVTESSSNLVRSISARPDTWQIRLPESLPAGLALLWLLGSLWQSMRLLEGWSEGRRLLRSAQPAPTLSSLMADVLPRNTSIAITAIDGPLVTGLVNPRILIPHSLAETLDPSMLRSVVLHEIAHIRRGDLWLALVQRVLLIAFWWSPFLRLMSTRLEMAREMACDARAAEWCGDSVDYASALMASVDRLFALDQRPILLATGIFDGRSQLALRIDGLVEDDNRVIHRHRPALSMGLAVAGLVVFSGFAYATTPRVSMDLSPTKTTVAPKPQAKDLIAAVGAGDIEAVRRLVRNGVDINAQVLYKDSEDTALIRAIWKHDHHMIDALFKLGADPDRGSRDKNYPMILATNLGYQSIVEQLLDAGADVNFVDREHAETPLMMASRQGHLFTVKYLIEHGATVNQGVVCDWEGGRWRSPLNQATDPAVRAYLISQGAVAERQ